eukprot:TRINITY_DN6498_c0_g1_i1.p1 TRINITY_DN6498_c0_g1~~TRINITY_DN6498_c0_g1_i1.p1  ORF type:complete len:121 (+),score=19.55 TRINITY_DN6498_c0_g1_i1:84-446(+)
MDEVESTEIFVVDVLEFNMVNDQNESEENTQLPSSMSLESITNHTTKICESQNIKRKDGTLSVKSELFELINVFDLLEVNKAQLTPNKRIYIDENFRHSRFQTRTQIKERRALDEKNRKI